MARGDIVSGILSVGAGLTATFQPAAGVEILLTCVALGANSSARLYDGTTSVTFLPAGGLERTGRIGITNSIYLEIYNAGAAAENSAYTGVQTA